MRNPLTPEDTVTRPLWTRAAYVINRQHPNPALYEACAIVEGKSIELGRTTDFEEASRIAQSYRDGAIETVALTLQDGTPVTLTIDYPEPPKEDGVSVTVTKG